MKILKRKTYELLVNHLDKKEYAIVMGARQTGKTTIMMQLNDHLLESGKKVYFISLEDMSVLVELNNHPENIFSFIEKPKNDKIYLLIDEIQYLDNPSNFLKGTSKNPLLI